MHGCRLNCDELQFMKLDWLLKLMRLPTYVPTRYMVCHVRASAVKILDAKIYVAEGTLQSNILYLRGNYTPFSLLEPLAQFVT